MMRALQTAFIQCGAVKKAWALYVRDICGEDTAPEIHSLFAEIGRDLVAGMSDATIKEMASQLIKNEDITEPQRRQLATIIRWRNKRP